MQSRRKRHLEVAYRRSSRTRSGRSAWRHSSRAQSMAAGWSVDGEQSGLLPNFAKAVAYWGRAYNARSETVATLASYRQAWAEGQRRSFMAEAILQPRWATSRVARCLIEHPGNVPMGIAGIYRRWRAPDAASSGPSRSSL